MKNILLSFVLLTLVGMGKETLIQTKPDNNFFYQNPNIDMRHLVNYFYQHGKVGTYEGFSAGYNNNYHRKRMKKVFDEDEHLFLNYFMDGSIDDIWIVKNKKPTFIINVYFNSKELVRLVSYNKKHLLNEGLSYYRSKNTPNKKNTIRMKKVYLLESKAKQHFCSHGYTILDNVYHCTAKVHAKENDFPKYTSHYKNLQEFLTTYTKKDDIGHYKAIIQDDALVVTLTKIEKDNISEINILHYKDNSFGGFIAFKNAKPSKKLLFYTNGKIKSYTNYHLNGIEKEVRTYFNDKNNHLKHIIFYDKSHIKNSVEKNYCSDGKIQKIQTYKQGKLLKVKGYHCNNEPAK